MSEKNIVLGPEELNKNYFQSLGATRASVGMLGLAWSGIFALSIALSHVYYFIKDQLKLNPFSNLIFLFFCVYLLFMLICQVISFNQKLIYRHQFFGTAMLFAMINGLLLSLVLTDYVIVVLTNNLLRNSFIYTIIFGLSSLILFLGLILYNVRWLKKQLETGFSEQRTNANYVAASSVYSKPSIWIILGATLLGGMMVGLITGYYKQILGIFGNLVFISAFSRLIVEVGYLLKLRAKDKTYWEEVPEELYNQSIFKTLDFKKTKPRLIAEVILFLGIIACLQLLHIDAENSPIWLIWFIRIFGYTIVLDATGSFIYYQFKKRKKRKC
jgi:membrane protein